MKRRILIVSTALNIVLVGALLWVRTSARDTSFTMLADATDAEVRLQAHILAELESNDPTRIAAIKQTLRRNIESGHRSAADWRRAAD